MAEAGRQGRTWILGRRRGFAGGGRGGSVGQPGSSTIHMERQLVPLNLTVHHAHRGRARNGSKHRGTEVLVAVVAPNRVLDASASELFPTLTESTDETALVRRRVIDGDHGFSEADSGRECYGNYD